MMSLQFESNYALNKKTFKNYLLLSLTKTIMISVTFYL